MTAVWLERRASHRAGRDGHRVNTTTTELPVATRQLVIVDDGSTDGTREWLTATELPGNVDVLLHPKNEGEGAAWMTVLERAQGTYSAILDAELEYAAASSKKLTAIGGLHVLRTLIRCRLS